MPSWDDFVEWVLEERHRWVTEKGTGGGRPSLRRRWPQLKGLAKRVEEQLSPREVQELLGKPPNQLDLEENDVKALVAYGAGKGILPDPGLLRQALEEDVREDPLFFLAGHSGKTFGEKYAPEIARFWLQHETDGWSKQGAKAYYDVGWMPEELDGREIRIEVKASSEHPAYRFQQVRHYWLSGSDIPDYDLLLCLGATARSLEWWAIPARDLDQYADNGVTTPERVVITVQHGKNETIWNSTVGYVREGWFTTGDRERALLAPYFCRSEELRQTILRYFS